MDLPYRIADPELQAGLERVADPEGRILAALAAMTGGTEARIVFWPLSRVLDEARAQAPEDVTPATVDGLAAASGAGRRVIVVEDYGRDGVSQLLGGPDRERRLVAWSRRDGPFLATGFKVRVLHCWWQWPSLDDASVFLASAFGEPGIRCASSLTRPRLAWKVALYHRSPAQA